MQTLRGIPGLLAGLILSDILINLPGFSFSAPVASLLAPSIDLLVVGTLCVGIAQAGEASRRGLRIAAGLFVVFLLVYAAGSRFGFAVAFHLFGDSGVLIALGCIASLAIVAAAGAATFLLSGLLVRGFSAALVRSIFVLAIALCAVLQVLTGRHLLAPSVVPRIISDIVAHVR